MRVCSVLGCGRAIHGHGYCPMHYQRVQRAGTPGSAKPTVLHWTEAERSTLRSMFAAGASDAEIGVALGRKTSAIQQQRQDMGGMERARGGGTGPDIQRPLSSVSSPELAPIYRPWSCRVDSGAATVSGDVRSWSAWLPMRARMVALEERDAARDARDAERFDVRLTPAGLVVRERAEVAA